MVLKKNLQTELLLNHSPLDCLLSAVDGVLRLENGPDIVESGLAALTKRVAKLSHSSVLSNSVRLPHDRNKTFETS